MSDKKKKNKDKKKTRETMDITGTLDVSEGKKLESLTKAFFKLCDNLDVGVVMTIVDRKANAAAFASNCESDEAIKMIVGTLEHATESGKANKEKMTLNLDKQTQGIMVMNFDPSNPPEAN